MVLMVYCRSCWGMLLLSEVSPVDGHHQRGHYVSPTSQHPGWQDELIQTMKLMVLMVYCRSCRGMLLLSEVSPVDGHHQRGHYVSPTSQHPGWQDELIQTLKLMVLMVYCRSCPGMLLLSEVSPVEGHHQRGHYVSPTSQHPGWQDELIQTLKLQKLKMR